MKKRKTQKPKPLRAWALIRGDAYYRSANFSVRLFTSKTHARDVNSFVRRDGYEGYQPVRVTITVED